jgi:hypothetical protein
MKRILSEQVVRSLMKELARRSDGAIEEETLVPDGRTGIGPAQFVEDKLAGMLREEPLHLSHAPLFRLSRRSLG